MAERFPLSWPQHWKRTPPELRQPAQFRSKSYGSERTLYQGLSIAEGMSRLKAQLGLLRAQSVLISTNIALNSHGEPTSRMGEGRAQADPGVAVYFELGKHDRVLACDKWLRVADNLAGVAAHIECIRGINRYGVGTIEQAFAGYDALPAPGADNRPPWRAVLEIAEDENQSPAAIQAAYRDKARLLHPDVPGGSHEAMAQLNEARDAALRELGQ